MDSDNSDRKSDRKNVPRNKVKSKRNKNLIEVVADESSKIFSNMVTLETQMKECLDNEDLSEEEKEILKDMRQKIFDMNMQIIETV